uniref:Uncharacterized protein n=1 Tax=viral metagenome TaxID=1070528 RepID=A0A6M3LBQ4_9ZZZZ
MNEHAIQQIIIDINEPFAFGDLVTEGGKKYRMARAVGIKLHTHAFDGLSGKGFRVGYGVLWLFEGYTWNGSNVVPDLPSCLLGSAIHDALCEAIDGSGYGWFARFRLRRHADWLYGVVCDMQGMWGARARVRYFGLRMRAYWPI